MNDPESPKVAQFPVTGRPYGELNNLQDELLEVCHRYAGRVPFAGVLGVLKLVEVTLLEQQG